MWAGYAILKKDINVVLKKTEPKGLYLKAGEKVTVTKGRDYKYSVWSGLIIDVPEDYIDESTLTDFRGNRIEYPNN